MTPFHHLLTNNLIASITNTTVWFAVVFWVFLETRLVLATGLLSGSFMVMTAGLAIWFGSLVDHHRKKRVMLVSSIVSLLFYGLALALYMSTPEARMIDPKSPTLWLFVLLLMFGVIAGNARMIALPTLVTALVPEDRRDKANGLVGMVTGISLLTTSALSGFLIAWVGLPFTILGAIALTFFALLHLLGIKLVEPAVTADGDEPRRIDLAGTFRVVAAIPGLFALIFFTAFNNLLGGVFMALMDAYGLSLMKVQQWGLLWAFSSCAFILSGMTIARFGLGRNPLRTLLLVNLIMWAVAAVFTLQSSILMLAVGSFIWMLFGPYAEAAEQTTLQKVVPFERQGRVFGFAQSIEQAASPMTAFLIAPLAQFVFIPLMSNGGAGAAAIGDWFGRGPERGIALIFTLAGLLGVIATIFALNSRSYRRLSSVYETDQPA